MQHFAKDRVFLECHCFDQIRSIPHPAIHNSRCLIDLPPKIIVEIVLFLMALRILMDKGFRMGVEPLSLIRLIDIRSMRSVFLDLQNNSKQCGQLYWRHSGYSPPQTLYNQLTTLEIAR